MPADADKNDLLLNSAEAAKLLRLSKSCLARWRLHNQGPPYIQFSPNSVRYSRSEITAWLQKHVVQPAGSDAA